MSKYSEEEPIAIMHLANLAVIGCCMDGKAHGFPHTCSTWNQCKALVMHAQREAVLFTGMPDHAMWRSPLMKASQPIHTIFVKMPQTSTTLPC